jgi:sugar O-acyltransferase (sialic acid O-acetyltransferase NeuD family)
MSNIIIYGGTGQAIVDRPILEDAGHVVVAIFDDTLGIVSPFADIPVHPGRELAGYASGKNIYAVIAIGNPHGRERVDISCVAIGYGIYPIDCISKHSVVRCKLQFGAGAQIMDGAIIQPETLIGYQVIVNTRASIDHECIIGDGCEVGPGATLCGNVTMEKYSWVGAGATILPRITIGEGAIVGAGAVVTHDVSAYTVVVGCPARFARSIK